MNEKSSDYIDKIRELENEIFELKVDTDSFAETIIEQQQELTEKEARIRELEGIIAKIKNMDRSDLDSGYRMYENLARKNERIKELEAKVAAAER